MTTRHFDNRASCSSLDSTSASYQEALLPCIPANRLTRTGSLFEPRRPPERIENSQSQQDLTKTGEVNQGGADSCSLRASQAGSTAVVAPWTTRTCSRRAAALTATTCAALRRRRRGSRRNPLVLRHPAATLPAYSAVSLDHEAQFPVIGTPAPVGHTGLATQPGPVGVDAVAQRIGVVRAVHRTGFPSRPTISTQNPWGHNSQTGRRIAAPGTSVR